MAAAEHTFQGQWGLAQAPCLEVGEQLLIPGSLLLMMPAPNTVCGKCAAQSSM